MRHNLFVVLLLSMLADAAAVAACEAPTRARVPRSLSSPINVPPLAAPKALPAPPPLAPLEPLPRAAPIFPTPLPTTPLPAPSLPPPAAIQPTPIGPR